MKKTLLYFLLLFFGATQFACATPREVISYTDTGGQGQPLVLIHAFPLNQQLWQPQIDGLKANFRVITLDLNGFGQAPATDGTAVTMPQYADEVKQLLDQLHIDKAIIGGESMGGYVALAFLQKYPDAVQGLILGDTQAVADAPETKIMREINAVDVISHGTTKLLLNFIPKALSQAASEQARETLQTIAMSASNTGVASALRGMALREDTMHVLDETSVPVLVITGKDDLVISPMQSVEMAAHSRGLIIVIPDAGHLASLEQPEEWNNAVMLMFGPHGRLKKTQ